MKNFVIFSSTLLLFLIVVDLTNAQVRDLKKEPSIDTSRHKRFEWVRTPNYWRRTCEGILVTRRCRYKLGYKVCMILAPKKGVKACRFKPVYPLKYKDLNSWNPIFYLSATLKAPSIR